MQTVAPSNTGTDITRMRTYIYTLHFQCLANSIDEADACFLAETQLSFGKKHQPATLSPNIGVQVIAPPMYPEMTERGRVPSTPEGSNDVQR